MTRKPKKATFVCRSYIKRQFLAKGREIDARAGKNVGKRTLDELENWLNAMIEQIISESVKTEYYKVTPIDVERAETKWLREQFQKITGGLFKA